MRAVLIVFLSATAAASEDPTESMNAERDALIAKIASGVDSDASVRRFGEMVRARDAIVATSAKAIADKLASDDAKHKAERTRYEAERAHRASADGEVGSRCTLSPDPAHPIPSPQGRQPADWGKVVRKEKTHLPPKNELDDGEPVVMYEVAGATGSIQFRGDKLSLRDRTFEANVGDIVLVCMGGRDTPRAVAVGWGPRLLESGFAVRLAEPPLVAKKAKFNPVSVTDNFFYWAIKDVKWKLPDDALVLINVEIDGVVDGRYEVQVDRDKMSFLVEAPPTLKHRELLQPGAFVWLILGQHRYDRTLKKLVVVAQDIEEHYIREK